MSPVSSRFIPHFSNTLSPYTQVYANRSDLPGGGTLGSIANTHVPVSTVDIGLAQLAMHSVSETAGVQDLADLCRAMEVYFGKTMTKKDGVYTL